MRGRTIAGWMWLIVLVVVSVPAVAQQNDVPILRPKKPQPKPVVATLLVMCDLACNWKLDGELKGHIDAGGSAKTNVKLGQHEVIGTTEDGLDRVEKIVDIKTTGQTIFSAGLLSVWKDRILAEKAQREKEQAAQDQASLRQTLETGRPGSAAKASTPSVLVWGEDAPGGMASSTVKDPLSGHQVRLIHADFADVSSTLSYSETPAGWMAYSVFAVATITVTNTGNEPIEIGGTTQTLEAPAKKYFDKEQIGCSYIAYWSAPRQKKTQPLPSDAKGTIAPRESRQFSVIMHVHMSGTGVPDNAPDASNVIGAPVPVRYSIRVGSQDFVFPGEIPTQYTGDYSCRPVPER